MKRGVLAALLCVASLGAGRAFGDTYFFLGGNRYDGYKFFQGYQSPTLVFSHQSTLSIFGTYYSAIADFNGDGYPDVAISYANPQDLFYVGDVSIVDGRTGSPITTILLNTPTQTNGNGAPVAAGDVNGDGISDLIVGPNSGAGGYSQIHVYSGKDWSALPITYPASGPLVATADFNHDGKSDIVTAGSVYDGATGNLLFTFPAGIVQDLATGDINGDGTPDIAVEGTSSISVYSGVNQQLIDTFPGGGTPYHIAVADMNQDGYADLLRYDGASGLKIFSGFDGSVLSSPSSPSLYWPMPIDAGPISAFAQAPEPGTLGILACGVVGFTRRRRKR